MMTQETIQQTFSVGGEARLKVSNIRGSVTVRRGQAGQIEVNALKHTASGDADHTRVEIRQNEDGSVVVETRFNDGYWGFFGLYKPCKIDYTIYLPENCRLRASGVSCSLDIAGLSGEIEVSSVSGQVILRDLLGDLKINSVSGSVSGVDLGGSLQLETVSGAVELDNCQCSPVKGNTVSGRIRLQSPVTGDQYQFRSVSGDVQLSLPAATGSEVHMTSMSGRFTTNLPSERNGRNHGTRQYNLGSQGPRVEFNSMSGDLRLNLGEDISEASSEDHPSPAGKPPTDPMDVLERIERGELSVEDGLLALSGEKV